MPKLVKVVKETAQRRAVIEPGFRKPDGEANLTVKLFATVNGEESEVLAYGLDANKFKLAQRLASAWKAKAFNKTFEILPYHPSANMPTDTGHVSPVDYDAPIGRRLSADLKRLGF